MSWFSRMFGKLTNPKSKYVTPGLEDGTGEGPPASDVAEQAERVARVEERLRGEGVPFNPDMEPVEAESTVQVRDRHEVADRLMALTLAAMKGDGMDHDVIQEIVAERDARKYFTPTELAYIDNPTPSEQENIRFAWRFESAWTLIWVLRLVREPLTTPRNTCDVDRIIAIVRDTDNLAALACRPDNATLDKLELFRRYHWAVCQALENGQNIPSHLDANVTRERFHALSWYTRQSGFETWDGDTETSVARN